MLCVGGWRAELLIDESGNSANQPIANDIVVETEDASDVPATLRARFQHDCRRQRPIPMVKIRLIPKHRMDEIAETVAHLATLAAHILGIGQRAERATFFERRVGKFRLFKDLFFPSNTPIQGFTWRTNIG